MKRIPRHSPTGSRTFSILSLVLLTLIGAIWLVSANKFERYVKEELPNRLENLSWLISINPESIKINKYLFKVTTDAVILWPNNSFYELRAEGLEGFFNPISQNISVKVMGDKLTGRIKQSEIAIDKPFYTIKINKPSLEQDLSKLNIHLTAGKTAIKTKAADETILSFDKAEIMILGDDSLIEDNYKVTLTGECKNMYIYARTIKPVLGKSYELASMPYLNIMEATGASDYEFHNVMDLKKEHLANLLTIVQGKSDWKNFYKKLNLHDEQYAIDLSKKQSNSSGTTKIDVTLSNNNQKIQGNLSCDINRNYTDFQKQELEAILTDILYTFAIKKFSILRKGNLTKQDFETLAAKIINVKKASIQGAFEYEKATEEFSHDLALKLNEHNLAAQGKGNAKEFLYDGSLKLSKPQAFINTLAAFIDNGLYPLVMKASVENNNKKEANELKQIANNLKSHGLDALSVFHNEPTLKADEDFISNLKIHFKALDFKINGKGLYEIITDERLKNFVKPPKKENNDQILLNDDDKDLEHKNINPALEMLMDEDETF